jgi:transposase
MMTMNLALIALTPAVPTNLARLRKNQPVLTVLAAHYGTAIVPARPYKPRDKAKVEVAVPTEGRVPTNSRLVWVLTKPLKIRGILRWALL